MRAPPRLPAMRSPSRHCNTSVVGRDSGLGGRTGVPSGGLGGRTGVPSGGLGGRTGVLGYTAPQVIPYASSTRRSSWHINYTLYVCPSKPPVVEQDTISDERLGIILRHRNPWWVHGGAARPPAASEYARADLAGIVDRLGDRQVHALIGARSIGKTAMLKRLAARLAKKAGDPRRIMYISLDEPPFTRVPSTYATSSSGTSKRLSRIRSTALPRGYTSCSTKSKRSTGGRASSSGG